MAPHSEGGRYWVSGQANSIFQMHGHFHSPYEGANSLRDIFEYKASEVGTLYLRVSIAAELALQHRSDRRR